MTRGKDLARDRAVDKRSRRHASGRRSNGLLIFALVVIAAGVALIDQLTKNWAEANLSEFESIPLLGNFLSLRLTFNSGAAFSIASGMTWVFTIIAVVVVIVVIRFARSLGSRMWTVAFGLLLGGAIGNLYDRLFRPPSFGVGHVVDFINYANQFIGNIADIAIVLAAILIGILALTGIDVDGSRGTREEDFDEEPLDEISDDDSEILAFIDDDVEPDQEFLQPHEEVPAPETVAVSSVQAVALVETVDEPGPAEQPFDELMPPVIPPAKVAPRPPVEEQTQRSDVPLTRRELRMREREEEARRLAAEREQAEQRTPESSDG